MFVVIGDHRVDVVDADCAFRPCFALGFDKGSFTQGRGYTSYHAGGPRPVCWTRHISGCPHAGVHLVCGGCHRKLAAVMEGETREKPETCPECGSDDLYWLADILPAITPCCENPDVHPRPNAYRQRCRSCGAFLTGSRLALARASVSHPVTRP